jgi:hypothetical protein
VFNDFNSAHVERALEHTKGDQAAALEVTLTVFSVFFCLIASVRFFYLSATLRLLLLLMPRLRRISSPLRLPQAAAAQSLQFKY